MSFHKKSHPEPARDLTKIRRSFGFAQDDTRIRMVKRIDEKRIAI